MVGVLSQHDLHIRDLLARREIDARVGDVVAVKGRRESERRAPERLNRWREEQRGAKPADA